MSRQALEQMVAQINESGLPSYFEHDPTAPPIGRAYAARLERLADGEWAVVVDFEFYDAGYRALVVQGQVPLAPLRPIESSEEPFEVSLDDINWEDDEISRLADGVNAVGGELNATLERRAAVPDPIIIFGLVNASVAFGWFAKGFFTKAGERLGEAVGDDLASGYRALKRRVVHAVAHRKPADRPPILLFHVNVVEGGRDVLIEGSSRDTDPEDVERFLDAGESLVDLARQLLPVLPNRRAVTKLHFRYDAKQDGWMLDYGLAAGSEAFLFLQQGQSITPDEDEDEQGAGEGE